MRTFYLLTWLIGGFMLPSLASACWNAIEPRGFTPRCPVIVTGTITRIDVENPRVKTDYDLAHITISAVHKNRLTDSPFRVGDVIKVRMHARVKVKTSTDLRYPLKDTALWLIELDPDGAFSLTTHPIQRQPVGAERKVIGESFNLSKTGMPIGSHTKAQWIAHRKTKKGDPKDTSRKEVP